MNPDLALITTNLARNILRISIQGIHYNIEIITKVQRGGEGGEILLGSYPVSTICMVPDLLAYATVLL
jgi:hypothetical protein